MGDIFVPLLVGFIIFSCIAYCFKRRKGGFVSAIRSPCVTVSSTHVASPVVNPPYPIDARHPIPAQPQIGFSGVAVSNYPTNSVAPNAPSNEVYPQHHTTHYAAPAITPYIPSTSSVLYPPSTTDGYDSSNVAPVAYTRPSAPRSDSSQPPPPYYEPTGQATAPHEKQCSYNPHF